ncbi:glutaminyl-peptide cyclotransferase [Candidatus Sumerlaeota bacterium]|nr:glutaminyl-peptide cyclotransferase [Candidatus Sumerlaeota bacterium]
MKSLAYTLSLSLLALAIAHGDQGVVAPRETEYSRHEAKGVQQLMVKVIRRHPHDSTSFTQGLLMHGGMLYESSGLRGRSSLRVVDLPTGKVKQEVLVEAPYFAEGLSLAGDRLIQITWQEQKALVYDVGSLQRVDEFEYEGEGWGLCNDGNGRLYMSDGTSRLTIRDAGTFRKISSMEVTLEGKSLRNLNELEWVDGYVYANVWQTTEIVKIDPGSGKVVAVIHAPNLLSAEERKGTDVLNGIAYDPETKNFLITGKFWPVLFEVQFLEEPR